MIYLKNIKFKTDIVFNSNREDHAKKFKVKKRTYKEENRRKPIYRTIGNSSFKRQVGYELLTVKERTFVIFAKDFNIEFNPVTVIVGDNGCGKSSLIKYINIPKMEDGIYGLYNNGKTEEENYKDDVKKHLHNEKYDINFINSPSYLVTGREIHKNAIVGDFAKHNTDKQGYMTPQKIVNMWDMQTDSNGESTLDFLNALKVVKNSLIILDEPETSLSIKSQFKVLKLLKNLATDNQLIVITHSEILMKLDKQVYDFESKEYKNTLTYIKEQYK